MSVGALVNVFGLLLLILFMFAVLGVFFFNNLSTGLVIDADYKNFKNFSQAYLLLFAIATGEDWNRLMYDCLDTPPDCVPGESCGTSYAVIYYIAFIMVITHVMLNLFILVIIQQFETYYVAEDNPIKLFTQNFDIFHTHWVAETQRTKCAKISERALVDFMRQLPFPMGWKGAIPATKGMAFDPESDMKKEMLKMGIRSENGWIYFNELLYRSLRRLFGNFKLHEKMQIIELKTQFKIFMLTLRAKSNSLKLTNERIFNALVNKNQSVNPFLTMMYYKISFHIWV